MKLENYQRVVELVKQISDYQSLLMYLGLTYVTVRIFQNINYEFLASSLEGPDKNEFSDLTGKYISALKVYVEQKIEGLTKELEAL